MLESRPSQSQSLAVQSELRSLPSVERLLEDPRLSGLAGAYSHASVVELARRELEANRKRIREGAPAPTIEALVGAIEDRASAAWAAWPRRVINATGVVIHTNLGRAPLSRAAIDAASNAAGGYTDLELIVDTGKRGSRYTHISDLLSQATGAEASLVVNNNAAAVLLALSALCSGKEVIISRGEAIEIGGGFRIPDVLRQSGATLVEVGTTNRTYARDYEAAITQNTAAILTVHRSNFTVQGFTHEPALADLIEVSRGHGVPILHDLGSGCLLDTSQFGLAREPMVQESIAAGADLAMFSGDKLLGGPQAGIIAGGADLVGRLSRHPLARALRVEKVTLASLSATLVSYLKDAATEEIPIWRMIAASPETLHQRARAWIDAIDGKPGGMSLRKASSTIGGGSLPGETLPTTAVAIQAEDGADALAAGLRRADPPVIGRIEAGYVLLDPRTVLPDEDQHVVSAVRAAISGF